MAITVCLAWARWTAAQTPVASARDIESLTGGHTRLAWVRGDAVVFLDTRDGRGEVEWKPGSKPARPIIAPLGRQVIFIAFDEWASHAADWGGGHTRRLVEGRVTSARMDERGREWIDWQTRENEIRTGPLDRPEPGERVWKFPYPPRENKTENWQTSADGRRAAASMPWPDVGAAALPSDNGEFVKLGVGCWPQMARDNSYRVFHLYTGRHNQLAFYNAAGSEAWLVPCVPNPRRGGCDTPRWANDPRAIVATDPSWHELPPDVYVGRFTADFTAIERWVRVTDRGDNREPDIWVAAAARYPGLPAPGSALLGPAAARAETWPGDASGLVFLWRNLTGDNTIRNPEGATRRRCLAALTGVARPARHGAVDLAGGSLAAEGLGAEFLTDLRAGGGAWTFEATISPPGETSGTLMMLGDSTTNCAFAVRQEGTALAVVLGGRSAAGADGVRLGELAGARRNGRWQADADQRVAVSVGRGRCAMYLNGMRVAEREVATPDPDAWTPGRLTFGANGQGAENWPGLMEGVALFARACSAGEALGRFRAYHPKGSARAPVSCQFSRGRLAAITPTPRPEDIRPYPRALVVYAYDAAAAVRDGTPAPRRIHVAHWAYLDGKPVRLAREVGREYALALERFAAHPHLERERLISSLDDAEPELFLDVGRLSDAAVDAASERIAR
jgi:hypothetical protein